MLLDKSIFVYRGKSKFIYVEECVVFQEITSKFIIRWCYILLVSMHKCTFFVYKWLFLTIRSTLWIKHGSRGWECKTLVFFHYPYWALVSHGPEIFVVIPPNCFFYCSGGEIERKCYHYIFWAKIYCKWWPTNVFPYSYMTLKVTTNQIVTVKKSIEQRISWNRVLLLFTIEWCWKFQ